MSKLLDALKGLGPEALQEMARSVRTDAWQNPVTGFGTSRDKTTYARFVGAYPLDEQTISDIYHGDAMGARMVDFVPDETTREGVVVNVDDDTNVNEWIKERLEALNLLENHADGERWGRAYGGAALILGADDGRPASMPLVPERAASLSYLYQVDRRMLWPSSFYTTPGHPKLGKPETYMVTPASFRAPMGVVHESRLILYRGAKTGLRERELLNSWDYSILQRAHDILAEYNTGWKAVSVMLTDAHQAVFKMAGLADAVTAGSEDAVKKRIALIDLYRSVMRAIVIDAGDGSDNPGEEFERQSVSFEQIPQTLEKLMLRLASTVPMPVTVLMGQSPAGMDATGDSDFRWHYDQLRSHQTQKSTPRIRRIVQVMLAAKDSPLRGHKPKKIEITWPPLWRETPKEEAERRKLLIEGDAQLVNASIAPPQLIALLRLATGGYERELTLTPELKTALERMLKDDFAPEVGDTTATGGEGGEGSIQDTVLNGAQIASLVDIVVRVASNELPRDAALQIVQTSFQVDPKEADRLLGSAGKSFKIDPPPAPMPFGGGPPKGPPGAPPDKQEDPDDQSGPKLEGKPPLRKKLPPKPKPPEQDDE